MKYRLLILLSVTFSLCADEESSQFNALKAWIATKRQVTIKERGGSLSLSGDVRAEYSAVGEQKNGLKNIGTSSLHPNVAADQFKIAFSLLLDYRADATWASVKLKFANNMGVISGTNNKINLERAFIGFRIVDAEAFSIDVEPGRKKLNYAFDSRIQFNSLMDGVLIKYDQSSDRMGDFYIHGGPFVVNEVNDLFAYIMETGILNIYNTGFYGKYSFLDWHTKRFSNSITNRRFQFFTNQFTLGYRFTPPVIAKTSVLYGAFLINSAAKKNAILNYDRANLAWYIGFSMGEVRKKGDWAIETNVQFVQPQAIPDFDVSGIGIGNSDNIGLYTTNIDGSGKATTYATAVGKGNYGGGLFEFLYLITDNLTVSQSFKYARSLHYLPTHYTYKQYRLEFIYAW